MCYRISLQDATDAYLDQVPQAFEDRFTTVAIANREVSPGFAVPPETGGCGFEVPLADIVVGDAVQTIRLRLAETGETLIGTPIQIRKSGREYEIVDEDAFRRITGVPAAQATELAPAEMRAAAKKGDYATWLDLYGRAPPVAADVQADVSNAGTPRFSVVVLEPATRMSDLERTLGSLAAQEYGDFEIILAGDVPARFARSSLVVRLAEDGDLPGLLACARGLHVTFVAAGDVLAPHALRMSLAFISANSEPGLVYSDEDRIDAGGIRSDPYFKGGWDPDLACAQDYFCRLAFVRADEVAACADGEPADFAGVYRTLLRHRIAHVRPAVRCPFVLYHRAAGSIVHDGDEQRTARVIGDLLTRNGDALAPSVSLMGPAMRRVVFPLPSTPPLVSIVVPTRDGAPLLRSCVTGLLNRTRYPAIEIVIVDNGSAEAETFALFDELRHYSQVKIVSFPGPFNYSAINNFGVAKSAGSMVVLMNNDIEVREEDWLSAMVAQGARADVGVVGSKLLYADDTIQHAGVVLGIGGVASHIFKRMQDGWAGYHHKLNLTQQCSAVTAACMLMRREVWDEVEGLSLDFPVAFNDVDLCLRVGAAGYRIIWTPQASLYHLESASRGREDDPEKQKRFDADKVRMMERWRSAIVDDPFYNPNLSLTSTSCLPAFPPRTDLAWYL